MGCNLLNILQDASIFEAVHGSAPDIAGIHLDYFVVVLFIILEFCRQGLGKSNCTFVVISNDVKVSPCCFNITTQLITPIRHMGLYDHANHIEKAALTVRL